jgi:hypothetical protein
VTTTDRATVTIDTLPQEAAGVPTASSRLTPPSGCQRGRFRVLVTGTNIRMVQFYVDGRLKATVRTATSGNRWVGVVSTRGLKPGAHRLRVRVTYTSATGHAPDLRSARFGVCRPPAVLPAFTG